jgi:hypothetical protein
MPVIVAGFVKNGVVVPSAPLPEGTFVEVRVAAGRSKFPLSYRRNSTPGNGRARGLSEWSNVLPKR